MNDAERWRLVRSIFDRAVELAEPQRGSLLAQECAGDPSLRDEVERLLRADEEESSPGLTGAVSTALRETAMTVRIGEQVGPYRVVGELGRGGMGVVLAGERDDGAYRRQVAIKILPGALHSDSARRRFLDERQILADLEHPSIAGLLEGGTTESGLNYLVMERVDGLPIDQYCNTNSLGVRARVRLMVQVCGAISHAHSRFVVHRDIKPSNVLVTRDGTPKLLDFGIAKWLTADGAAPANQTVDWFLTPEFASPEQLEGKPITAATDVYGLGALLYYLLAGQSPLATVADTPAELVHAITHRRPEPPSVAAGRAGHEHVPVRRLSAELDAIVCFALRKEPARRYASAEQLAADLNRFLTDRPIKALPDSLPYRASKFLRRQWIPVTAAALAALSLAAGFTAREIESRRAQREAQSATEVAEFLESLFAAATPEEKLGKEVSAEDLLDRGAER
ncbi:MAG: serine/threonine-protein kinase, partial [Acidobacteriota bacterium]